MREGDWTAVVAPEKGVWWMARTASDHQRLAEVVDRLTGFLVRNPFHDSLTEWEAMQVVEFGRSPLAPPSQTRPAPGPGRPETRIGSSAPEIYAVAQRRIRKTLRALTQAVDALVSLRGHKSLVMFSEGFVLSPSLSREYDRVIDTARRAQVAVYFIDPTGLTSGQPQAEDAAALPAYRPPGVMREGQVAGAAHLSLATGGREYASNDVLEGVRQGLDEASVYYLLGFEPPSSREGEHRISVRALRDGVHVRSRDRYFLRRLARPDSPLERAVRAVSDEGSLPLRVTASLGGRSRKGEVETTLVVDLGGLPESFKGRSYRFVIEGRRADGRRLDYETESRLELGGESVISLRGLRLLAGLWQIRLVVQDKQTSALGSVLHTLRIPDPT